MVNAVGKKKIRKRWTKRARPFGERGVCGRDVALIRKIQRSSDGRPAERYV